MPLDPARESAAWEVMRSRKIYPRPLPDGTYRPEILETGGGPAALTLESFPEPVVAIERGVQILQEAEMRRGESRYRRIASALAKGVYVPWPRDKADGTKEWLVLRASDRGVVGGPHDGYIKCGIEIARLLNEPVE